MRKQPEVEEKIKNRIRGLLALHPGASVRGIQEQLQLDGLTTTSGGKLDWHYVQKMMHKVRTAAVREMNDETFEDRMVDLRETNSMLVDELAYIVTGLPLDYFVPHGNKKRYPTHTERINAAKAIMDLKYKLLFMEEKVRSIRSTTVTEKRTFDPRTGRQSLTQKWSVDAPEAVAAAGK